MAAPRSQKAEYRPIGFLLQDLGNTANDRSWVRFNVRPEDLSVIEPSRASVQQTLGGAWLDNFGPGLKQINISGHTGWRARFGNEDGFALFRRLKQTVFDRWHEMRGNAIQVGRDPDLVQLVFVDDLDELSYVVAPLSFSLRRNKSRPLLMQYQISMIVLSDQVQADKWILLPDLPGSPSSLDDIAIGGAKNRIPKAVVDTLRDSVARLQSLAETVDQGIDKAIGQPVKAFMEVTNEVLDLTTETVAGVQGAVDTATSSLIDTANNLARAGMNIAHTVAAVQGLPASIQARFMEVASAYGNANCVLSNAFGGEQWYPDYSDLYGSSYCSSTSGGSPLSPLRNENPFYRVAPVASASPVTVGAEGLSALAYLSGMDVLITDANADLMSRVSAAASNIVVQEVA